MRRTQDDADDLWLSQQVGSRVGHVHAASRATVGLGAWAPGETPRPSAAVGEALQGAGGREKLRDSVSDILLPRSLTKVRGREPDM